MPILTFRKKSSLTVSVSTGSLAYLFHRRSRSVRLVEVTRLESMNCSGWAGHIHLS